MTTLILSTKIMFFDKFSSYLGYISEEHNEEPWLLDILKLWSHQSKHDQAIEQDCEPVVGKDHLINIEN